MAEPAVAVRVDVDRALVQIAAVGEWTSRVRADLASAVRGALAERPRAVLLDLDRLTDADGAVVSALRLAQEQGAGLDPPVPVVAVASGTAGQALQAAGLTGPVYARMADARRAVAEGLPPPRRARVRLEPDVWAPSAARGHVGDTCLAWGLRHLLHPARAVVSELATNAVEHAGTPFVVTVSRRSGLLYVAVEDAVADPPYLLPAPPEGQAGVRGNGLRIVAGLAVSWGAAPTTGGKVVWATLRTRPPAAG